MEEAKINKICEEIKSEFERCFQSVGGYFVVEVAPDTMVNESDICLWCNVKITEKNHRDYYCYIGCEWDSIDGIRIELDESGLEPISPETIWRLMFFDALHDLWTIRER